jgi:RNA polymerase subunit RPABC4/transcription elongation factor Spt4
MFAKNAPIGTVKTVRYPGKLSSREIRRWQAKGYELVGAPAPTGLLGWSTFATYRKVRPLGHQGVDAPTVQPRRAVVGRVAGQPKPSAATSIQTRPCPFCKGPVRADASICPHCQQASEPWRPLRSFWVAEAADGTYWWLHQPTNNWFRVRQTENCPSCAAAMSDDVGICPSCETRSSSRLQSSELAAPPAPQGS